MRQAGWTGALLVALVCLVGGCARKEQDFVPVHNNENPLKDAKTEFKSYVGPTAKVTPEGTK